MSIVSNVSMVYLSAHDTKFFIILFERAFKMMKNGVYFTLIALLLAELFKIYGNYICVTSQKEHKVVRNHKKLNICANT